MTTPNDNKNLIAAIRTSMRLPHSYEDGMLAARLENDRAASAAAAQAFADINRWKVSRYPERCMTFPLHADRELFDHAIYFIANRRAVAVVGQPYPKSGDDKTGARIIADFHARAARMNLAAHVPPNPFASFHYPGFALFLVLTFPGVDVRWLPEQLVAP